MRWTLVVPGALLPSPLAADLLAHAATPWLRDALARARVEPDEAADDRDAPHLAWLWRRFGGSGAPVTAPYALAALDPGARVARDAQCWHLDPVHLSFARDHWLVMPLDDAPLRADEAAVLATHLCDALTEHVPGAELRWAEPRGGWLLRLARPWSLAATSLDGAIGQPAHEHWPEGEDARTWRKLLNDVQMRWHEASSNESREARGERTANALWLHGGGLWRALPERPFAAVVSDDPLLRGWAVAAGLPHGALHGAGAIPHPAGDVLSLWRGLLAPARIEAWGAWLPRFESFERTVRALRAATEAAGYDELALVLAGSRCVRTVVLRRGDGWRLWRRSTLADVLKDGAPEASA